MQSRLGKNNLARGKYENARAQGATEEELLKISEEVQKANNEAFMAQGAKIAMENMIKEIDLENPVIQLINQIEISDPDKKQERKKNVLRKRRRRRRKAG
jgi:hypothetical protein